MPLDVIAQIRSAPTAIIAAVTISPAISGKFAARKTSACVAPGKSLPRSRYMATRMTATNRNTSTAEGIVRITAKRRHWAKNVERLCGTELAPLGESGGTVQLEIFAAVEMAFLIEMIVYG